MRALLLSASLLAITGCSKVAVDLDDLACDSDERCLPGWRCDPVERVCVAEQDCTAAGAETCDGADNDCNGTIDDVADINADCALSNSHVATWQCTAGNCVIAACDADFYDFFADTPGCETHCVTLGAETCNDRDDDCSGVIDDVADLFSDCASQLGSSDHVDSFTCEDGACGMVCAAGWVDELPGAGCETACSGPVVTWYHDADLDGFTAAGDTRASCVDPGAEWLDAPSATSDCDDEHARTFPGAAEHDSTSACMRDDDEDGYGDTAATSPRVAGTDCDDSAAGASPAGTEAGACADGLDNDCDTLTDGDDVDDCAVSAWWDAAWGRRVTITVDNTTGAEELTDFPLLVMIDDPPVDYGHTRDLGQDLRFVDPATQSLLDHQIERWDESGVSHVWVKIPTVPAGDSTVIYLYYGNDAADAPSDHDVWSNGFVAVWHLREQTGAAVDSSGYDNHAFSVGSPNRAQMGVIGRCVVFNEDYGHDDSFRANHAASLEDLDEMTLEAWIRPLDISEQEQRIVQKRIGLGGAVYGLHFPTRDAFDDPPRFELRISNSSVHERATSTTDLTLDEWSWVATAYDFTTRSGTLYLNNTTPQAFTLSIDPDWNVDEQIDIGGVQSRNERGFRGGIDEVRISNVRRSDAWMAAQFRSMNGAMAVLGLEETP